MPKKKDLEQKIRKLAKQYGVTAGLVRQGSHEIWECAGFTFPIPRHREIAEGTARIIVKRLTEHLEGLAAEEENTP